MRAEEEIEFDEELAEEFEEELEDETVIGGEFGIRKLLSGVELSTIIGAEITCCMP